MLKNANLQIYNEERDVNLIKLSAFMVILSKSLDEKAKCKQKVTL